MDPVTLALIGMGSGLLKSIEEGQQKKKAEDLQVEQTRMSPWTHMGYGQMAQPQNSSLVGNLGQGGLGGYQLGQQNQNTDLLQQLAQKGLSPSQIGNPNTPAAAAMALGGQQAPAYSTMPQLYGTNIFGLGG